MTNRTIKKPLAVAVALASLTLGPMLANADPRSDGLIPLPQLYESSLSQVDEGTLLWSQSNARQAVTYMTGYAFTYEQVYRYGCALQSFGDVFNLAQLLDAESSRQLNVVSPNNDTVYSIASLPLDGEPWVFHAPASLNEGGRYWSLMLQDAASNVPYVIGSASTGTGDFVIAWKGWEGQLPKDLPVILMDTPFVWPLIRTGVYGPDDLDAVDAIQQEYSYTPLSEYCANQRGKNQCKFPRGPQQPVVLPSKSQDICDRYPENFDSTPTGIQNNPLAFWEGVNAFTTFNPPPAYETSSLSMYEDILVGPGQPEDFQEKLSEYLELYPIVMEQLLAAPGEIAPLLAAQVPPLSNSENGWDVLTQLADYGDIETGKSYRYLLRGAVNMYGPGGLPASEALYYNGFTDGVGEPLDGTNTYKQVFVEAPPVGGFWSLTLYSSDGFLYDNGADEIIENDIYSIGSNTVVPDANGGFVLTISHSPDGTPPAGVDNWLPAPDESFYVILRTYVPLDPDNYFPPPLVKQ